jgi:hypothetical protein
VDAGSTGREALRFSPKLLNRKSAEVNVEGPPAISRDKSKPDILGQMQFIRVVRTLVA